MIFFLIVSVMLVILLGGCAVNTASVEKEGKTNNTTEQKEYDSLDDYFKELTGDGVSISKPTFTIEGKKLNICFEVGYPQKVIDKLKNTKQMSYYQVIEEEGNGILAKYTKTIENKSALYAESPFYENDLNTLEEKDGFYFYKIEVPLLKKPTKVDKTKLMDGKYYALVFLNEKKERKNVIHGLDQGLHQ